MIRKAALTAIFFLSWFTARVVALGLGEIEASSSLNEPLEARIPLRSPVSEEERESMQVNLASAEQFARAGLERPFILTRIRFSVVDTPGGGAMIRLSSRDPVKEPFLNFLVEVNWPQGRVIREFTLLLDPPVFDVRAGGPAASQGFSTSVSQPLVADEAQPVVQPDYQTSYQPTYAPAQSSSGYDSPSSYGPVRRNETLWAIANRVAQDPAVSVQQMMLGLLQANPEAFFGDNINNLKAGATLRVPDSAEVLSMTKTQAVAEVNRQFAAWQAARGRGPAQVAQPTTVSVESLADASSTSNVIPMAAAAETDIETPTASDSDAPAETSTDAAQDARLKLMSGGKSEEGGDGEPLPDEDVANLREQLKLALEEVEAKRRENDELRSRLTESESLLEDMQRLLNLKDDSIAALRQKLENRDQEEAYVAAAEGQATTGETPGQGEPPETTPGMTDPQAAVDQAAATSSEDKPVEATGSEGTDTATAEAEAKAPIVTEPPQPTSTVDVLMGMAGSVADSVKSSFKSIPVDPKIAGGGVGVLALLGGWLWMRRRQGAAETVALDVSEEDVAAAQREIDAAADAETTMVEETRPVDAAELEAEAAADTLGEMPSATAGQEVTYDEDPLAEVNVYLAYERYEQAEELVREAIDQHPDRHDYKLKLLEIFVAAKNVDGFRDYANNLRSAVGDDSALMEKASEWWQELAPGQELFAETPAAEESLDTESNLPVGDSELAPVFDDGADLDFDLGGSTEAQVDGEATAGATLDFDLGLDESEDADLDISLDDLAAAAPPEPEEALGLDLTLDDGTATERAAGEADDMSLDFVLDDDGSTAGDETRVRPSIEAASVDEPAFDEDANTMEFLPITQEDTVAKASAGNVAFLPGGMVGGETTDSDTMEMEPVGADGTATGIAENLGEATFGATLNDDVTRAARGTVGSLEDGLGSDTGGTLDFDLSLGESDDAAPVDDLIDDNSGEATVGGQALDQDVLDIDFGIDGLADSTSTDVQSLDSEISLDGAVEGGDAGLDLDFGLDFDKAGEQTSGEQTSIGQPDAETKTLNLNSLEVDGANLSGAAFELLDDTAAAGETSGIDLDLGQGVGKGDESGVVSSDVDELQNRLDLAHVYIDMGDNEGAREILNEVVAEGSDPQKQAARELLTRLG